jgi:hypothetical protein
MNQKHRSLKQERFKKVAGRRVGQVLEGLEKLAKCSDRNNYDYTDDEVNKMIKVIREQVDILERIYSKEVKNKGKSFEF